jgi:hypothetical protein
MPRYRESTVDPQSSLQTTSAHERLVFDMPTFGRLIGDHLVVAVAATKGHQHVLRWVNPAFHHLMGKSPKELTGRPFVHAVPLARANGASELLDHVLRTGDEASSPPPIAAQGGLRSRSYRVVPLFGAHGRPDGLLVWVDDTAELMLGREWVTSCELGSQPVAAIPITPPDGDANELVRTNLP